MVNAMCTPRLEPAMAWISSMITVSTEAKMPAAFDVSIKYADSGVVINTSGGLRSCRLRSDCGVSPDRIPMEMSGSSTPKRCATRAMPASGTRRLRSISTPSAFSGEIYNTLTPPSLTRRSLPRESLTRPVDPAALSPSRSGRAIWPSRSMRLFKDHKKAARVLPEPVGATSKA